MARLVDQFGRPFETTFDKMFALAYSQLNKILQPKDLSFISPTIYDQYGKPIYSGPKTLKFRRYNKLTP
jgi:hypothetical protein